MTGTAGLLDLTSLEDFVPRAGLRAATLAGSGFRADAGFFFTAGAFRAATVLGAVFFAAVDFLAIFLEADFLFERAINLIGEATFLSRPE
jgi:hypothetical protein